VRNVDSPSMRSIRATMLLAAGPILVALLLSARTLGWGFLWDDYDFLGRVASLKLTDLLPVSDVVFYRPISRELYFWGIQHILGGSQIVAHFVNAAVVSTIIVLLVSFVGRLAGPRAAFLSGLFFACSAPLPLLMGWISASQDLLCLLFAMVAFHLQLSRKALAAALAMTAALLSKETAIALMPIPISIAWLQGASLKQIARTGLVHVAVLAGWAFLHPWSRGILLGDPSPVESGAEYVAFRGANALTSAVHGLALTFNLPWHGASMRWTGQNVLPAIVATGGMALLLTRMYRTSDDQPHSKTGSATLIVTAVLLVLGPIAMTSLALEDWSPHYALIPALGFSMLAGYFLGGLSLPVMVAGLAVFLWLGIAQRDTTTKPTIPSETNFAETDRALKTVERAFKQMRPTLLANSNVYVSVQARGHGGIYRQLFRFQPLRVWYGKSDIWVLDPNRYRPGADAEYLFWITPDLGVVEIDTQTLEPKGTAGSVDMAQYKKTLRGYSFGLAAGGRLNRAVQILITMPQNSMDVAIFDRRSAAMLLLAAGRHADAAKVLQNVPSFDHASAVAAVSAVLIEPVAGLDLDEAAMRAFDLNAADPSTIREVMAQLDRLGALAAAGRFAQRLQTMMPGDPQSASILKKANAPRPREIMAPIPYDIPQ
jgi:hypothetical protein